MLQKIMHYPLPKYLYDKRLKLHEEENSYNQNGIFIGGIGFISGEQRDCISILAEEYSRMESVSTAVIFAITDKQMLEVSVRSSNVSLNVDALCKKLFNGGGNAYKGGGRVSLGFYDNLNTPDKRQMLWELTCENMKTKVLGIEE